MPPLDWGRIMGADIDALQEDLDAADDMYGVLEMGSVSPDSEEAVDANKMIRLFEVTKAVMKVKSLQAELVAEEMTKGGGGEREQELMEEIAHLERDLQQYKKYDGAGGEDFMREIRQIESRRNALERELNEKEGEFFKEKNKNDQLMAKLDEAERENKTLRRDLERSKMDMRDLQRQIEQQRESMVMRRGDNEFKDKISKKNKELSEYLDEIRVLQEANDELEDRIKSIQKELEESTTEMTKMTDEYTKLKTILQQSDMIIDDMRKERDALRAQVQDLRVQFATKTDTDDQIMVAVNAKVEEWKAVLAAKEIELEQYKSLVQELKQQVTGLEMDSDKTSLAMLQQAVVEKDEKIEMLKKELEKATSDMHGVASYVEEVKSQTEKGVPSAYQQKRIKELNSTLQREQLDGMQLKDRMIMAETAAAMKDKQLNDLLARMMQYERGEYGLSEAVQEIKDCKAQIRIRDQNIEDLTNEVNNLEIKVNDTEMENEELRERLGMDPKEKLDIEDVRHKKKLKAEQAVALNRALTKEIERLEEERLQLKRQLRKQAMHRGARAVELGITAEDLIMAEEQEVVSSLRRPLPVVDSDSEVTKAMVCFTVFVLHF